MKRGVVVAIAVGAVVAVAAAGAAWWALTRGPSARDVAEEYLQALSSGDVDALAGLVADPEASAPQLAAFAGASEYASSPRLVSFDDDAALPGGEAEVTIGGETASVFFGLERIDGRWRISHDHLGAARLVTTIGDSVGIGDALFATAESVPLFPGRYDVVAAPARFLTGSASIVVTGDSSGTPVTIDTALTPDATAAAQEQLDAYATECTRPAAAVPEHCGIRVPWPADLTALDGVAFRVEAPPTVTLTADGRSFAATGGVLVATATGTDRAGATASVTYRADDWALFGTVAFSGEEMVLSVR